MKEILDANKLKEVSQAMVLQGFHGHNSIQMK